MEILADGRSALAISGINQWQGGYPQRDVVEQDVFRGESYAVEADDKSLIASAMISFRGEKDYLWIEEGAWLTDTCVEPPVYVVVHRVAVDTSRKGKGVASFILRNAEKLAATNKRLSVRIDTHADNTPMRNLLKKKGYTPCGKIHITHDEGLDSARIAYEKLVSEEPL